MGRSQAEAAEVAAERGWEPREDAVAFLGGGSGVLPLFQRGSDRVSSMLFVPRGSTDAGVFRYAYETEETVATTDSDDSADTRTSVETHEYVVAAFRAQRRRFPAFRIGPRPYAPEWWRALMRWTGWGASPSADADPAFARRYVVRAEGSSPADAVRILPVMESSADDTTVEGEVLTQGARDELLTRPGWHVEGEGEWVILYREDARPTPRALADHFDAARRIMAFLDREQPVATTGTTALQVPPEAAAMYARRRWILRLGLVALLIALFALLPLCAQRRGSSQEVVLAVTSATFPLASSATSIEAVGDDRG